MEEKAPVKKVYKKAPRKKVCAFCQEKIDAIDYKDVNKLKRYEKDSIYIFYMFIGFCFCNRTGKEA